MNDKREQIEISAEQLQQGVAELLGNMTFEKWRRDVTPASLKNDLHAAVLSIAPAVHPTLYAENESLRAEVARLREALERTLSWLTSYPGNAAMGPDGPYEQARASLKVTPP